MTKKALIIGVTGQDGSYLADFLIKKGYVVHGIKRRSSIFNTTRIDHLYEDPHIPHPSLQLHFGDLTDLGSIIRVLGEVQPDEIYNLGAMSHVKVSFDIPEYTGNVDGLGTLRVLEAIRILKLEGKVKFFQASTSEMYGNSNSPYQDELTPFRPESPYATAKLFSYWSTVNYREAYGIFASNGILFNHESPVRGETFVTRKITRFISKLVRGEEDCLYLGNLDASRDWGHAKDYVEAMWLMLQHKAPDDFVIATGVTHTVREFLVAALKYVGIEIGFKGEGKEEIGFVISSGTKYPVQVGKEILRIDSYYYRPNEVGFLRGNAQKAREVLEWKPTHSFESLVADMMESDL